MIVAASLEEARARGGSFSFGDAGSHRPPVTKGIVDGAVRQVYKLLLCDHVPMRGRRLDGVTCKWSF